MRVLKLSPREKKILRGLTLIGAASHSVQKGRHASAQSGSNVEFKEYKSYSSGDDLKTIDWKVKAKSDKLFIKTYHEDVNLNGVLLLDISHSMGHSFFNENKQVKFEAAVEYAFILSELYFLQGESLALYSFTQTIEAAFKLGASPQHYKQLRQYLQTVHPTEKRTDPIGVITEVLKMVPLHSKIILVSDLYIDPRALNKIHQLISVKKCQLDLIHIIDNKELRGHLITPRSFLTDAESQKEMLFTRDMAREYSRLVQKHCEDIKKLRKLPKVRVCSLIDNASVFKQLLHFFSQ